MLPYHPLVLKRLAERPRYREVLPEFLSALGRLSGGGKRFPVCDALDPRASGCAETDFMDAQHPIPSCSAQSRRALSGPATSARGRFSRRPERLSQPA